MHIDIYTGHWTDNEHGAAFTAILSINDQIADDRVQLYGTDDTYQTIFIKGVLATLKLLAKFPIASKLSITVHSNHNNTSRLMGRIEDVFNNVRKYNAVAPSQIKALIDLKMRRKNRSKFDNHDELVQIVGLLMDAHYKLHLQFSFKARQTQRHEQMRDAMQFSELLLEQSIAEAGSTSNVIEFKKVAS